MHPHTASIRFKMDCSNAISSLDDNPLYFPCQVPPCRSFCFVSVLRTELLVHDDNTIVVLVAAVRLVTVTDDFDAMDN